MTVETILGEVKILFASMIRKSGYGQYSIAIEFEFEGVTNSITMHSTDSMLFDRYQAVEDNKDEYLVNECYYSIGMAIEDYINSL